IPPASPQLPATAACANHCIVRANGCKRGACPIKLARTDSIGIGRPSPPGQIDAPPGVAGINRTIGGESLRDASWTHCGHFHSLRRDYRRSVGRATRRGHGEGDRILRQIWKRGSWAARAAITKLQGPTNQVAETEPLKLFSIKFAQPEHPIIAGLKDAQKTAD